MAEHKQGGGGFLSGLIIGGLIGAAVGLLVAPKRGEETRTDLMEKSEGWRAKLEGLRTAAQGSVGEVSALARESAGEVASRARESAEALAAKGKGLIEEAVEEGRKAASASAQEMETRLREEREKASKNQSETT